MSIALGRIVSEAVWALDISFLLGRVALDHFVVFLTICRSFASEGSPSFFRLVNNWESLFIALKSTPYVFSIERIIESLLFMVNYFKNFFFD